MTARILDGKAIANNIREEIAVRVSAFRERFSTSPKLVAVLVGDDPASQVYVRNKEIACQKAGIQSDIHRLSGATTTEELLAVLDELNADPKVHGILVQLPLPDPIDTRLVLDRIDPRKDVDAFSPENVGLMLQGRPRFLPCTPHGVMQLLNRCKIAVQGKQVVVVGRSDIVGKPLVCLCMQKSGPGGPSNANATVTCCHSQTPDLDQEDRATPTQQSHAATAKHPTSGKSPAGPTSCSWRSVNPTGSTPRWSNPVRWSSTSESTASQTGWSETSTSIRYLKSHRPSRQYRAALAR